MKNYLSLFALERIRISSCYKPIQRIHHFILNPLVNTVQCGSARGIVHWVLKLKMEFYGFGLAHMLNMINYWVNKEIQPTYYSAAGINR